MELEKATREAVKEAKELDGKPLHVEDFDTEMPFGDGEGSEEELEKEVRKS